MEDLKPCPFCGSKPFVWRTNYRTYIECPNLTTESHNFVVAAAGSGRRIIMAEYIEREAFLKDIEERYCLPCKKAGRDHNGCMCDVCWVDDMLSEVIDASADDVEKMSDGYHTFADLYEQRLILSAALAKNNPHAWKSKRHEDGSVPFGGGWFIMGFDTDEGCYTYHYELKDWDLFQCEELDKGKPWDGHTSKDVRRLLSIPAVDVAPVVRCRECKHRGTDDCIFHIKGEPADEELLLKLDNDFCSYGERKEGVGNG